MGCISRRELTQLFNCERKTVLAFKLICPNLTEIFKSYFEINFKLSNLK